MYDEGEINTINNKIILIKKYLNRNIGIMTVQSLNYISHRKNKYNYLK